LVRLRDDEDEAALRSILRSLFATGSGDVVRRAEPLGHDDKLWQELVSLGVPAMAADPAAGGGGATVAQLAVAAEELGRALAPVTVTEHQLAASAVAHPDPAPFADVIAGETVATLALRRSVDGWWRTVPGAAVAGVVVGMHRDRLVAIRQNPPGTAPPNLGSQALADVRLDDADLEPLGDGALHADLADRWRVLTAASLVGLSESALEIGMSYVLERKQFGVPIGTFQAVQHGLADLPGLIAGARLLTGKAAWALDQPGAGAVDVGMNDITHGSALASMAVLFAAEVAERVTDRALHFQGGYGVARESEIQLHYRRGRAWPLALGPAHLERRRLASLLFAGGQPVEASHCSLSVRRSTLPDGSRGISSTTAT
jgi:alkylation response protein AidB-like acyl-CoA dehydrogenase